MSQFLGALAALSLRLDSEGGHSQPATEPVSGVEPISSPARPVPKGPPRLPDAVLPLDDLESGTINYDDTTGSGLVSEFRPPKPWEIEARSGYRLSVAADGRFIVSNVYGTPVIEGDMGPVYPHILATLSEARSRQMLAEELRTRLEAAKLSTF